MLVDYLEEAANELKVLQDRLMALDREYRKSFDSQAREEMGHVKKDIRRKRYKIVEHIYDNFEEFRLLKKHFPDLLNVFMEDELIGSTLKKNTWVLDLNELPKRECEKKLAEITAKRAQLKEAKDFLKGWVGKIDAKSLVATWNVLKDVLKEEVEKEDALVAINDTDKRLKREGWLIVLNDPLILKPLHRFFKMLKKANEDEYEKRTALEKVRGRGTLSEFNATKDLRKSKKKRERIERICRHILLASHNFLAKIKKQKMTWRDRVTEAFMRNFLEKVGNKEIDEKRWVREMKKKMEA